MIDVLVLCRQPYIVHGNRRDYYEAGLLSLNVGLVSHRATLHRLSVFQFLGRVLANMARIVVVCLARYRFPFSVERSS